MLDSLLYEELMSFVFESVPVLKLSCEGWICEKRLADLTLHLLQVFSAHSIEHTVSLIFDLLVRGEFFWSNLLTFKFDCS